jgi:uncharacterized protein YbjT (DUF2867 family)
MDAKGWLTGPVAITGADGQVGTALQKRLADLPNDVRPLGRGDDPAAAFRDAQAAVLLAGTLRPVRPNTYVAANLDTVVAATAALMGSAAERVVFLSYIDADPHSRNPYLRLKAEAEEWLEDTGIPTVIFRSTHILGTPDDPGPTAGSMLPKDGKPVSVLGPGMQRYAWVPRADAVEALVRAALDPSTPTGTFELAGPEAPTVDEFVRHVAGEGVRVRHIRPWAARLLGRLLPSLPSPLVDVMLRDSLAKGDPQKTADRFGFTLHGLFEVWPR